MESVEIPNVANITVNDAKTTLKEAGFKAKVVEQESDLPEGTVLSQSPEAGSKYQPGITVTLIVSSGAPPVPTEQPTLPSDEPTFDDQPTEPDPTETDGGQIFDPAPGDGG